MTAPAIWPAELPLRGRIRGVSGQAMPDRVSFPTNSRKPIERAAATADVLVYDVEMTAINEAKWLVLDTFYKTTLSRGTYHFAWIHPRTTEVRRVKFVSRPADQHHALDRWRPRFQIRFVDVAPAWAGMLTTSRGYMQIVDRDGWAAL